MPVIGRLDEQVDEKLIRPISQKSGDADSSNTQDEMPAPLSETENTRAQRQPAAEERELPVWLL